MQTRVLRTSRDSEFVVVHLHVDVQARAPARVRREPRANPAWHGALGQR
jgi:hypothetical protein